MVQLFYILIECTREPVRLIYTYNTSYSYTYIYIYMLCVVSAAALTRSCPEGKHRFARNNGDKWVRAPPGGIFPPPTPRPIPSSVPASPSADHPSPGRSFFWINKEINTTDIYKGPNPGTASRPLVSRPRVTLGHKSHPWGRARFE